MGQTKVGVSEKVVYVVEAECSGEKASWTFNDKGEAMWVRDVVQEFYMARCPTCLETDILGMQVSDGMLTEVIVSCGNFDCEFAKRIVRTTADEESL